MNERSQAQRFWSKALPAVALAMAREAADAPPMAMVPMGKKVVMRPALVGAAKCERKGHRPVNAEGRCSRCKEEV